MAHAQPDVGEVREEQIVGPSRRRRRIMIGLGCLLAFVMIGAATIITLLQRLETRTATFQPPMTSLERQQLLPPEPVLEVKPQVEGLRYGAAVESRSVGSGTTDGDASVESALQLNPPSPDPSVRASTRPLGVAQTIHVTAGAR